MAPNREVRGVDLCLLANRSAGMGAGCGVGSGPQVDVFGLNKWILKVFASFWMLRLSCFSVVTRSCFVSNGHCLALWKPTARLNKLGPGVQA